MTDITQILEDRAFKVGSSQFYPDWVWDNITAARICTHKNLGPAYESWGDAFDSACIYTPKGIAHVQRGDWIVLHANGDLSVRRAGE